MRAHLAVALALLFAASPAVVRADNDGLPPPAAKAKSEPEPAPSFQMIYFETGSARLTIQGNGDYEVHYPGGFVSRLLDDVGVSIESKATGKLTPQELADVTQQFGSSEILSNLEWVGPLYDNQVLSKMPLSLDVYRRGTDPLTGDPVALRDHFQNDGGPTNQSYLLDAVRLLNGIADRATDGYVFGGKAVTGTFEPTLDSDGNRMFTLTDDSGKKFVLSGAASESDGFANLGHVDLAGYPTGDLSPLVGKRVVVHGVVSGEFGGTTVLVPTRAIESAPGATVAATGGETVHATPGLTGAVQAATGQPK